MELLIITAIAFSINTIATPLAIFIAKRYDLVDDPQKRHHPAHIHQEIIPRAGGLAIYIGLMATILIFIPLEKYLVGILAGITVLLIIGLIDDKKMQFNPYLRLLLLFLTAALPVGAGIGISFITNPFYGLANLPGWLAGNVIRLDQLSIPFHFLGDHKIILIADLFALLWIVTLTQVVNWSKGVDGQMPGIILVTALVIGLLSLKFYYQGDTNQLNTAKLSFIVAGTALSFLIFNWHPAKIIPGFSGSTIFAFMIAVLSILSTAKVATALLVLAVPTVDFIYTFWRRIFSGRSPVWADRGHLHHRLLNLGWSPQKISLFYIFGSAILGAVALYSSTNSKIIAAAVVVTIFVGFILWLNFSGGLSKPRGPGNG